MSSHVPPPAGSVAARTSAHEQEYADALSSIHRARLLFFMILVLSLVLHIGVYCMARWTTVFDVPAHEASAADTTPPPAATGQTAQSGDDDTDSSAEVTPLPDEGSYSVSDSGGIAASVPDWARDNIVPTTRRALLLSAFLGRASCAALVLCYLLAMNVTLVGGLGGVRGHIRAILWIVLTLALLFPWPQWIAAAGETVAIPGAYAAFHELIYQPSGFTGGTPDLLPYVRYIAFPAIVLLMVLVADQGYTKGYRLAKQQVAGRLGVRRT